MTTLHGRGMRLSQVRVAKAYTKNLDGTPTQVTLSVKNGDTVRFTYKGDLQTAVTLDCPGGLPNNDDVDLYPPRSQVNRNIYIQAPVGFIRVTQQADAAPRVGVAIYRRDWMKAANIAATTARAVGLGFASSAINPGVGFAVGAAGVITTLDRATKRGTPV